MTTKPETCGTRPRDFLAFAVDMFGPVALNRAERAARFLEEALELVQAEGLPIGIVHGITTRVYSRPPGDLRKEVGQAAATLEMLAENVGLSADLEAQHEFNRVRAIPKEEWQRRHAAKVKLGIADLLPFHGTGKRSEKEG